VLLHGIVAMLLAGCSSPALERFSYSAFIMGSRVEITVFAPDEATARPAVGSAFDRIRELDRIMSDYLEDSELSRLHAHEDGDPVAISNDLAHVLTQAQRIARASDGCFDVTVGALTQAWRPAMLTGEAPSVAIIRDARTRVGWRGLRIERDERGRAWVSRTPGSMRIDLGGIGKGFAGDAAVSTMRAAGLPRCLVNVGGDVMAGEAPPGTSGWHIDVASHGDGAPRSIRIANSAVATSGDAYRAVVIDGVRWSHIIDPKRGTPLSTPVQVTVCAARGAEADAWASAWSVRAGEALFRSRGGRPDLGEVIREAHDNEEVTAVWICWERDGTPVWWSWSSSGL